MKKDIALKWVAALRSGDYVQGNSYLRIGNRFCCRGVLCNLHAQAHPDIAVAEKDPHKYMGESRVLPRQVMDWAGITLVGRVRNYHNSRQVLGHPTLSDANDAGKSFASIANWIEKNYHLL